MRYSLFHCVRRHDSILPYQAILGRTSRTRAPDSIKGRLGSSSNDTDRKSFLNSVCVLLRYLKLGVEYDLYVFKKPCDDRDAGGLGECLADSMAGGGRKSSRSEETACISVGLARLGVDHDVYQLGKSMG